MYKKVCAVLTLLVTTNSALAASFDCKKAQSRVEKMVCADANLSDLDEHLGRYYEGARIELQESEACFKTDQTRWLKSVRNVCSDSTCIKTAYLNRLSELDALQPGANAIKYINLPRVPTLVWIIPSALDKVAAPPNPKATLFEATGTLVDEIKGNPNFAHGFVLHAQDGTSYPLVLLMFLEGKTPDYLSSLASQKGATFTARGHAAKDKKGKTYFEPSRCIFIYRIPSTPSL